MPRSTISRALSSGPLALVAVAALAGCGSSGHRASTGGRPIEITISNYAYHPADVTVAPGTKVTFINRDQTAHTATSASTPAAFDTGTLNPGHSKTITIARPGTYAYLCQFHAFMHGTLRVAK